MIALLNRHRVVILALLIGNGLAQAAAAVAASLAVEAAFVRLAAGTAVTPSALAGVAGALTAAAAASAWLRARERVDAERIGQSYTHDLRLHLFERLTAMSPRAVGARSQGGTALRFIGDLSAVRKWVSLGIARLCVAVTMVLGTLVALTVIHPALGAATGVASLIGAAGAVMQGPGLRSATRKARRRRSRLAGRVVESIGAVGVVQANNAVDRERRRIRRDSRRLRRAMIARSRRLGRLVAVAEATGSAATALLLVAGLVLGIPAAKVAAGMTVVGLLVPQLRGLARVQEYRQHQHVAVAAIRRFLERPTLLSDPDDPEPLRDGRGELRIERACYDVARDVSVAAPAGRTVAVVGPNGAGKSTLFAMIGRMVDLDGGRVLLDGSDLARVSLSDVHAAIGMAGPDLPLMRGSLRRNLTYHHRGADASRIAEVIDLCDLGGLIDELADGLETKIAENGANLSSGQRQRVLLARAIMGEPRVLLLDEADANLDAHTTGVLDRVLAAHQGSALVITHRRSRVAAADDVWHLHDGRLIERGPAAALLEGDGPTARLFAPVGAPS